MTNIKYNLVYLTVSGLAMHGYAIIEYKLCALALVDKICLRNNSKNIVTRVTPAALPIKPPCVLFLKNKVELSHVVHCRRGHVGDARCLQA